MNFVDYFSAHMHDLMDKNKRDNLIQFAKNFFHIIENKLTTIRYYYPIKVQDFQYQPNLTIDENDKIDATEKNVILITDSLDDKTNLGKMINRFIYCFKNNIKVINLNDLNIKGGCLGCLRCSFDNHCAYEGKDDFTIFWNNKLKNADIIIFAGKIYDRYLSAKWKMLFDRSFFNGHVPTLIRKQFGFIISGPFSKIPNLKQILSSYVEFTESNLVDIITDEFDNSEKIDMKLLHFATKLIKYSEEDYIRQPSFLYYGGKKIFRDDIYKSMRSIFQADHRYYKKHGYYDFPKKPFLSRIMMLLFKSKRFRNVVYKDSRMQKEMIKPLQKIIQKGN